MTPQFLCEMQLFRHSHHSISTVLVFQQVWYLIPLIKMSTFCGNIYNIKVVQGLPHTCIHTDLLDYESNSCCSLIKLIHWRHVSTIVQLRAYQYVYVCYELMMDLLDHRARPSIGEYSHAPPVNIVMHLQ